MFNAVNQLQKKELIDENTPNKTPNTIRVEEKSREINIHRHL